MPAMPVMRSATSETAAVVPWTLVTKPAVAARCWSIAAATELVTSDNSSIASAIAPIEATAWLVVDWISAILAPISPVALPVCVASVLTSVATTAKPRPASPARAASIVALSASRLVCSAIAVITPTMSPMSFAAFASAPMVWREFAARSTAVRPISEPSRTFEAIASIAAITSSESRVASSLSARE